MNSLKNFDLINKTYLIEKLIKIYKEKVESAKKAMESSKQAAVEAEGRMQTRYGSTKEEKQMLMDAYAGRVIEYQKIISYLQQISNKETETVDVMSLVGCRIEDKKQWYLIVPIGGGEDLRIDNYPLITSISYRSPLAQDFIGLKVGDQIELGDKVCIIEELI